MLKNDDSTLKLVPHRRNVGLFVLPPEAKGMVRIHVRITRLRQGRIHRIDREIGPFGVWTIDG